MDRNPKQSLDECVSHITSRKRETQNRRCQTVRHLQNQLFRASSEFDACASLPRSGWFGTRSSMHWAFPQWSCWEESPAARLRVSQAPGSLATVRGFRPILKSSRANPLNPGQPVGLSLVLFSMCQWDPKMFFLTNTPKL